MRLGGRAYFWTACEYSYFIPFGRVFFGAKFTFSPILFRFASKEIARVVVFVAFGWTKAVYTVACLPMPCMSTMDRVRRARRIIESDVYVHTITSLASRVNKERCCDILSSLRHAIIFSRHLLKWRWQIHSGSTNHTAPLRHSLKQKSSPVLQGA